MPVSNGNSPLGVHDPNSVRDRIRQWQSQGGGVVTPDDTVLKDDEASPQRAKMHTSARNNGQRTSSRREANRSPTPPRSGRSAAKPDDAASVRTRSRSTPAKRVVSDQHWRQKRSLPKSTIPHRATEHAAPTGTVANEGIQNKSATEPKPDENRRCASSRTTPKRDASSENSQRILGTRMIRSEPRRRSRQPTRRQSEDLELVVPGVIDLEDGDINTKCESEASVRRTSWTAKAGSQNLRGSLQKDNESEDLHTRGAYSEGRGSHRSHKGNILNKIFTKQAPEPIITPRAPSIEQWLHETPDPFMDAEETPVEVKAPLRLSSHKKNSTPTETIAEDPNQIWNKIQTEESTERTVSRNRRRKRIASAAIYEDNPFPSDFDVESGLSSPTKCVQTETASKLIDLVNESPEKLQPSLTRRGANKSVTSPLSGRRKSRKEAKNKIDDKTVPVVGSAPEGPSEEPPILITPLKPPSLGQRRPFPSTGGHRLSTIASVETFNTNGQTAPSSFSGPSKPIGYSVDLPENGTTAEANDYRDLSALSRKNSRITKHADLMSVLSLPRGESKSIQSARSIRTNRSRLATATTGDLMHELATDEKKYMRELRTLVDGVIPVLLSCVLSRSDSAVAAGLFRPSTMASDDTNFTKPIVDMGIALERLKTLHKRMPVDASGFLTWAHGAQRVYIEYLKSWRMGFQDVVVNLAPAVGPQDDPGLEEGLPRNVEGDVLNGDGERVDVAFLLKRPLVRLKYLAKTLKGLHFIQKSNEAESLTNKYQSLVEEARQRSNEERARLEDEAAANIDTTRARDLRTLAPLVGVNMDRTRRVRARDHFNLALQHSSGQRVDCRVELLFRDEASGDAAGGDVLICEVDGTGRWLLFPPVQLNAVSARNGDLEGEIIIMIRGSNSNGNEWRELFALVSEDENAGFEWVQMLGLNPVPPQVSRSQSFISKHHQNKSPSDLTVPEQARLACDCSTPGKSRTPSPREIEVPIGEVPQNALKARTDLTSPDHNKRSSSPFGELSEEAISSQHQPSSSSSTPTRISTNYVNQVNDLRSLSYHRGNNESKTSDPAKVPRSFKEALGLSGSSNPMGLKRASAKRLSRRSDGNTGNRHSPMSSPAKSEFETVEEDMPFNHEHQSKSQSKEHSYSQRHRSPSSTPSMDPPHIPKARKTTPPTTPISQPAEEPMWSTPAERHLSSSPTKLTKKRPSLSSPEPHSGVMSPVLDAVNIPVFEKGRSKHRRSSSPLKHEYDPSTESDTSSESGASTVERNKASSVSDDSSDEELEDGDAPTPLLPLAVLKGIPKPPAKPPSNATSSGSIKPSDSASQAPYKVVPSQPAKACKTIASIFTWLDTGRWEQLHPDECSIVITPGLIEAFEMSAAHSHMVAPPSSSTSIIDTEAVYDLASTTTSQNDDVQGDRPLVALELTPLVPLRRGTALDISIRSPPTPQSRIASSNNIMFRSRNPEECEALYALINHSRIHNPTFIALQNARGPNHPEGLTSITGGRRPYSQAGSHRTSWFGGWGRSSSYRASSRRSPSLAPSDSSIGSMSSAFSALKRFSARNNGVFNIAQSTIGSRTGSRAGSVYATSDNSSGSGTNSPIPSGMMVDARKEAPIGLTDAKIRIYIRETASKWRDMGSARLTIKRADTRILGPDGRPMSSGGLDRQLTSDKRIIINGKTKGEVLLDVQLGESCFERVARTGIAVSVWEDVVGPNGEVGIVNAVGGVAGGRAKVYMIQMKSEAETAYTFSLVGKLRY